MANEKLKFTCDYMEGAHPLIMDALLSTNMMQTSGYGLDEFSASARDKIRKACDAPDAGVYFLVGGTQTNATVIDALLRSYQGVLCAETGQGSPAAPYIRKDLSHTDLLLYGYLLIR